MAHPPRPDRLALVSGLDVSGYGIARSLGRVGISVFSLCSPRIQFGRFSRYSDGWFPYPPSPEDQPDQVCQLLLEVRGRFHAPPVLFATSDWFTQILCSNQEKLAGHYLYHWIPRPQLESIVNKAHLAYWCFHAGVAVPQTYITHPGEDILAAARAFSYPCLVKPTLRTNPFFRAAKNILADSPARLLNLYARHPELAGTTIWQQYIEGDDENVFQCTALVRSNGTIGGIVTVRKLAQYPANGMMCFGRTEHQPDLELAACGLLERMNYRGLASIEFKYSPHDGRFYFIEINARLPWYNSLFAASGVNLSALAHADLTGEPTPSPPPRPREHRHWVCVEDTAKVFLRKNPASLRAWGRFLGNVGAGHSFAWLDWRDPLPILASTAQLLWRVVPRLNPFVHRAKSLPPDGVPVTGPSTDSVPAGAHEENQSSPNSGGNNLVTKPARWRE